MENLRDYSISEQHQKIYSHRLHFSPTFAAAIMLNIDPIHLSSVEFQAVDLLNQTICELADAGIFKNKKEDMDHYGNEWIEWIDAKELKQWALSNGYYWLNDIQADNKQIQIIENQAIEIEQLKLELENQKKSFTDEDKKTIHGHSTPAIKALFDVVKRFWINADLSQSDTVANVEDIEKWIIQEYGLSQAIAIAIQKITRPDEARYLGRKS